MDEMYPLPFENKPVVIAEINIPEIQDTSFQPIQKAFWKVILLQLLVITILIILAFLFFVYKEAEIFRQYGFWMIGGVLAFLFLLLFLSRIAFQRKAYQIRTHDIIFRKGILSMQTTILPINRIQQIKLEEGLFSKLFNLASIGIYTSGSHAQSQIRIPGVQVEDAHKIRTFLISKIKNLNE